MFQGVRMGDIHHSCIIRRDRLWQNRGDGAWRPSPSYFAFCMLGVEKKKAKAAAARRPAKQLS